MNDLSSVVIAWARQFESEDIFVMIDTECFDQDYGKYVQIQITPNTLEATKVEIMIVDDTVGFTVECWSRLSRRMEYAIAANDGKADMRVGAFLEPGVADVHRAACLLDAIVDGNIELEARIHNNRLVGSSANVRIGNEWERLQGPATGSDLLRAVGLVRKVKLTCAQWPSGKISLTEMLSPLVGLGKPPV